MDFFDGNQENDYFIVVLRRIFAVIFVTIANWGMYLSFCQAYGYPRAGRLIISNIIFYSVLFAVIFSLSKRKCIIGCIIVAVIFFSRIYSCYSDIEKQADDILKYIRHQAFIYYNQTVSSEVLTGVHFRNNLSGQALILALLFISIAFMMASVLRGTRFVTILFMLSVLASEMVYGITPEIKTALSLFISAAALCAMAQGSDNGSGRWKVIEGNSFSSAPLFVLAVVVLISLFLGAFIYGAAGKKILAKHEKFWKVQAEIENKVQNVVSNIERRFVRDKTKQKLTNDPPVQTGRLIMTITTDKMPRNSIFLRENSSDTYEGSEWNSSVDYSMSNEECLKLFSQNYSIADKIATFTLGTGSDILTGSERRQLQNIKMEMEYYSSDSNLIFPYWADIEGAANIEDSGIIMTKGDDRSIACSGKKFSFQFYDISDKNKMKLLNQRKYKFNYNAVNDDYSVYVQRHYMNYPNNLTGLIGFADNLATVTGVLGGEEAQFGRQCSYIRNGIWKEVSYSKELDRQSPDKDFTEDFLLNKKRGYCVHYATAGTLLCRMKHLPARYVSGYRVDPGHFREVTDRYGNVTYMADVYDTQGHAWTEVYKSYLGWVPIEMTEAEDPDSDGTEDYYNAEEDDDLLAFDDYQSAEDEFEDIGNNNDIGEQTNLEDDYSINDENGDDSTESGPDVDIADDEDVDDGGTEDGNGGNDGGAADNYEASDEDEKFRSVVYIIFSAVILLVIALSVRQIVIRRSIKQRREYESLDRSKKLIYRSGKLGKVCAKTVKLKYKTLDDTDILGVFMRIGDGEITKQEIDRLGSILERAAFSEHEISEEFYAQAEETFDKI